MTDTNPVAISVRGRIEHLMASNPPAPNPHSIKGMRTRPEEVTNELLAMMAELLIEIIYQLETRA